MERDLIRYLRERLPQRENVLVGPGDDAAVLRMGGNTVVTTDMLMDGVDFILSEVDPRRVGRKALAVNLSDLAAMAARPVAAFVSVCLPRRGGAELALELCEGMAPLAEEFECSIAGGDTNSWDGPLVINITAIGETTAKGPLLRSGAKAGDAIVVTGSFGGSIHGKHLDFTPRVKEALYLHEHYEIHAATDVSDGLSLDLWNICEESGVGASIDERSLPIARDAHQRSPGEFALSPLDRALGDGEDFELILAVPWETAHRMCRDRPLPYTPLALIGSFESNRGMWLNYKLKKNPGRIPITPRGYEHRLDS
jgi:thiamine-monophosphate kinase